MLKEFYEGGGANCRPRFDLETDGFMNTNWQARARLQRQSLTLSVRRPYLINDFNLWSILAG